jgi:hypothetical protein
VCEIECFLYVGHPKNWAHQAKREYIQPSKKKKLMIPLEVLKMDLILSSVLRPEKTMQFKKTITMKNKIC